MKSFAHASLALALAGASTTAFAATECNGFAELCSRGYDEVTHAATHNSFASTEDGYVTFNGNHNYGVQRQLEDGVRALNFDTHWYEGEVAVCHGGVDLCPLASKPLSEELQTIKSFLDENPQEVVTIDFQDGVSASDTADVFEQVGLYEPSAPASDYLYAHTGGAWPTLGQMIDSGERVVVFTKNSTSIPWLHRKWTWMFRTQYSFQSIDDFNCDVLDGSPSNDLFMLPHFITGPLGSTPKLAAQANGHPFFETRVAECIAEFGRNPNLVRVDYHDIGELATVVEALNGVQSICRDLDGDGYGSPPSPQCTHAQPDCDDGNGSVFPGASGAANDCDPTTGGGCGGTIGSGSSSTAMPLLVLGLLAIRSSVRRRSTRD